MPSLRFIFRTTRASRDHHNGYRLRAWYDIIASISFRGKIRGVAASSKRSASDQTGERPRRRHCAVVIAGFSQGGPWRSYRHALRRSRRLIALSVIYIWRGSSRRRAIHRTWRRRSSWLMATGSGRCPTRSAMIAAMLESAGYPVDGTATEAHALWEPEVRDLGVAQRVSAV